MGRFCVISGDDDFAVKERARALAAELAGGAVEDNEAVEIVAGDNEALKPEQILNQFLDSLRTPPFLCDSKLIWLRHFDLTPFFGKEPAGAAQLCAEFLCDALPPEISVLLSPRAIVNLWEGGVALVLLINHGKVDAVGERKGPGLDQRKTLAKNWKKAGCEFDVCNTVKTNDKKFADNRKLNIRDICSKWGKSIDPGAVQYLSETIGGDSGLLSNELEKLALYVGDNPRITLEDCQAVCCRTPETVSWEFTGAITAGNTELALKLLTLLLQEKDSEMRLMATLSGEFQKLIQTRLAMKELKITRVNPRTFDSFSDEEKSRYPNNPLLKLHPYRAFKVCENAAAFSDEVLAKDLELVRNAARALVSGGGDRRMVLEQLVLKLSMRG